MSTDDMSTEQPEVEDFTGEQLEATQDAQEPPQQPEDTPSEGEPEDDSKTAREAAKYRRRLRETEAERDALTERVETLQRAVVDGIAATEGRMRPSALWAAGTQLGDLLDEHGDITPALVVAACDAAARDLGITRRPRPNPAQREDEPVPTVTPRESMTAVVMGKRDRA